MKKVMLILVIAMMIGFVSCEKDNYVPMKEEVSFDKSDDVRLKSLQGINVNEQAVATHAANYWNGSYYPRYAKDCASFASQCLEAGGISQISGEWYYNLYNPTANWNNANTLYNYLVGKYVTTKATFYASSSSYYNSIKSLLVPGALVFFDYDGNNTWDHVMIIHRIGTSGNPELAGHTSDEFGMRMDWAIYYNNGMSSSGKAKYVKVGY